MAMLEPPKNNDVPIFSRQCIPLYDAVCHTFTAVTKVYETVLAAVDWMEENNWNILGRDMSVMSRFLSAKTSGKWYLDTCGVLKSPLATIGSQVGNLQEWRKGSLWDSFFG